MNKPFQKIYFDPYLFFSLFLLSSLGLFFLFSASNSDIYLVLKQMVYVIAGFIMMILVSQPDPDIFRRTSGLFLIFSLLLLGLTYLFGPEINGAQRWVRLGPFSFQSSELLKLAVPIFLANFLFDKKKDFLIIPEIFAHLANNLCYKKKISYATSFGATTIQSLAKVKIPLAVPAIKLGVNQTVMMALALAP